MSWPTPPIAAMTRSCSTSSETCSSRSMFLSLLLEERGAGDLAQVAEHCRQKLIRRHPHVFGDTEVADAAEVLRNWDAIKATEPGASAGCSARSPRTCRRCCTHASSSAGPPRQAVPISVARLGRACRQGGPDRQRSARGPQDTESEDQESFRDIGERLFALVDEARLAHVDPELALRAAAQRFREKIGPQGEQ